MSALALEGARKGPMTGVVLIEPRSHFDEAVSITGPALLLLGEKAPSLWGSHRVTLWELRFPALDESWRALPAGELHALVEATVLWVRARSVE
jgi:hypothetical protein